ncbi:unnamed protein product [Caenorhabditis auriculariae]|uniref:Uncharacterized protein n=1 Tax=Caenorhabditis auriculariae TaxID=2777116 RepID=A0A8S1HG16_9PELO|nr:unnamed protein product [Caenorhabditis auriculariae]
MRPSAVFCLVLAFSIVLIQAFEETPDLPSEEEEFPATVTLIEEPALNLNETSRNATAVETSTGGGFMNWIRNKLG